LKYGNKVQLDVDASGLPSTERDLFVILVENFLDSFRIIEPKIHASEAQELAMAVTSLLTEKRDE
jgi:hypothetical protein